MVGPELALVATANAPGGRGAKDGADIGIVRDVQVAPGARGIGALKPEPAGTEGDARALKFADAEPAQMERPTNPLPVDHTLSTIGLLASGPEKTTDDAIDLFEDGLVEGDGDGREEVSRDGT